MNRGESRWYTFRAPDKRRPVLLLTRNSMIVELNEIVVAPVTRTIRGLSTEVVLTSDDGMPITSAVNFDHIALAQRDRLGAVLCLLPGRSLGGRSGGVADRLRIPRTGLANKRLNSTGMIARACAHEFPGRPRRGLLDGLRPLLDWSSLEARELVTYR